MNPLLIRKRGMANQGIEILPVIGLYHGAYMDTGYYPNINTEIVCDVRYLIGTGISSNLYGISGSSNPRITCYRPANGSGGNIRFGSQAIVKIITNNADHVIIHNKSGFSIDGSKTNYSSQSSFTMNRTMRIGMATNDSSMFQGLIRYFTIKESGVVQMDIRGARKKDNNELGFIDIISNTFFPNLGNAPLYIP